MCVVLCQCLARLPLRVAVPIAVLAGIPCLSFAATPSGMPAATAKQPAPKAEQALPAKAELALATSATVAPDFAAVGGATGRPS